jgi:hypothetical protein
MVDCKKVNWFLVADAKEDGNVACVSSAVL